jgi:hypothetical protein
MKYLKESTAGWRHSSERLVVANDENRLKEIPAEMDLHFAIVVMGAMTGLGDLVEAVGYAFHQC